MKKATKLINRHVFTDSLYFSNKRSKTISNDKDKAFLIKELSIKR